jgi:hypothetical protein
MEIIVLKMRHFIQKLLHVDYQIPTDGNSGYRITIVWTDPAGTVSAPSLNSRTPKLVNDLDIRLFDPSDGETHYPWILDPNNPSFAATKGDNFRDNVEVIDVPYLPASNYVLRVNHKGQLANNQQFTLIISKIPIIVPIPEFYGDNLSICPGESVTYTNYTPNIDFFTKYTWSFPGGVPNSYVGKTPPPITYNQPGSYNVLLIGTNGAFTKNTLINNFINVSDPKPGSASIVQNCEYDIIFIDTIGKFNPTKVDWYLNNIKYKTTTELSSFYTKGLKNGDVVKAIIESKSNCNTIYTIQTESIILDIPEAIVPLVNITTSSYNYCDSSNIILTANASSLGEDPYFSWYVNNKNVYSSIYNTFPLNKYYLRDHLPIDVYCICSTRTPCNGENSDTSNVITVNYVGDTEATLSISAPKTNICNYDNIEIEATTTFPVEGRYVEWYVNNQFITNSFIGLTFSTSFVDGDEVYCKITSSNLCVSPKVLYSNVITFTGSEKVIPTVTVQASATNICEGENVTFYATPFAGSINPIYVWYHNEIEVQNGLSATWSSNELIEDDLVYCIIYPVQCTVYEYAYSNPIYITIRERFSNLSISTPDTAICTGTSVTFTATLTNPGFLPNYKWKINGVSQGNRGAPTFTTSTLKDGDVVECEVQQSGTCAIQLGPFSNKIKMAVFQNTAPTLSIETISGVCPQDNIVFRANGTHTNSNTTFQWLVNGVTKQNSKSNIFSTSTLQENDFVNCIMFTNSACATSNTASSGYTQIKFQSNVSPSIFIEQRAINLCENKPIEFYLYSGDSDPTTTYSWKINGETVLVNNNKSNFITSALRDNDVVSCLLTSQNQCLASQEILSNEISIQIVIASPTIRIESTLFCKGTDPIFYAITTDVPKGSRYYWKKNGSYENTGEDSTYTDTYFQEGDVISCTLIPKACPGDELYSNEITIPAFVNVQPNITISQEGSICSGKYATFKATATDGGTNPIYKWKLNRVYIQTDTSNLLITTNFKEGDLLYCTLVSSEPCALGTEINSLSIVIHIDIPINVNLNVLPKYQKVCEGQLQEFTTTASVPENQLTYSWWIENIQVNDATSSTFSSDGIAAGEKVTCKVESDQICIDPFHASVTIDANVKENLSSSISISTSSQTICDGTLAVFSAIANDAGAQPIYEWFVNSSSKQKGISNQFFISSLKDKDSVSCKLTPVDVCTLESTYSSNSIILNVIDASTPTINIKLISSVTCENGLAEFQADVTHPGPYPIYEWRVNDQIVQSSSNYNFTTTILKDGDLVKCNLIRNDGCAGQQAYESNSLNIQLAPRSTPVVEIIPSKNVLCNGDSLQFTINATHKGQTPFFKWYINDSLIYYGDTTIFDVYNPIEGDVIYCTMESNEECITETVVKSNTFTIKFNKGVTPTVQIKASSTSTCQGNEVIFTATSTNEGTQPTYEWFVGNTSAQKGSLTTFSTTTLNDKDVIKCVLESNIPCATINTAKSNSIEISITENVKPIIQIVADQTEICAGGKAMFSSVFANGGTEPTFDWTVNNISVQNSTANTFSSIELKDNDKVSCIMTSNSACASPNTAISNEVEISVVQNVQPTVQIVADNSEICAGQKVLFKASSTGGGSEPMYEWFVNNVSVQNSTSNTYSSADLVDSDNITCTLTSNSACASPNTAISNEVEISVVQNVQPTVQIVADNSEICAGQKVLFKASSTGGGSEPMYEWFVNNVSVQNSTSNTYSSADLVDSDNITCTLTSNSTCASPNTAISNELEISIIQNVTPTIKITADQTNICIGQKVIFTAVSTGGGSEPMYEWFVNNVSVQNSTSNTYSSADLVDSDNITCTLTSNSTCASPNTAISNELEISIIQNVTPTIKITADQTNICIGQKVIFTAVSTGGGSEPMYEWFVNNVSVQNSTSNTYSSADLVDSDNITCTLTSNSACASPNTATSNEVEISVVQNVQPTVQIVADNSEICSGQKVLFKASSTGGGSEPMYEWFVNNVSVQNSTSNTYSSADLVDSDNITCTLTSNSTCASPNTAISNEVEISVVQNVQPTVQIVADNSEICAGQKVLFKASSTGGGSEPMYEWFVNNVSVQNSTSNTYSSADLVDSDNITCTLTSNSACASPNTAISNEVEISVVQNVQPTVQIVADNSEICAGQKVLFKASSTGGGSEPMYEWFVNNVSVQNSTSNTYSSADLVDSDNITCTLTSNSTCASPNTAISNELEISIIQNVTPTIKITADQTNICIGQKVIFTAVSTGGGSEPMYEWFVNNVSVQNSTSNTYSSADLVDSDNITCTLTSNSTCASPNTAISNELEISIIQNVTPTIKITADQTNICIGQKVIFTAVSTGGGSEPMYEWFVNNVSVQNSTSNTYSSADLVDSDNITCTLTSNSACASPNTATSNEVEISVVENVQNVQPTVQIVADNSEICSGQKVLFKASSTGGGSEPMYEWFVNNVSVQNSTSNTYSSADLVDSDNITCTLTSNSTCASPNTAISNEVEISVVQNVQPTVQIVADNSEICAGQKVLFKASSTGGGSEPMYEWFVNNVSVQNSTSNTYSSADLVDSDNITCTLTSNSACASPNTAISNEVEISVVQNVQPTVQIVADNSEICAGQKVLFKASSTGGGSEPMYEWFVNNVSVQNSTSNTYSSADLVDSDNITCTLTSNSTCASPNTAISNELEISIIQNVTPTIKITADQTNICIGQKVIFTAVSTGGGSEPMYEWFVNNVSVQNSTSNTYSSADLVDSDNITCTLTSNSTCASPNTAISNELEISIIQNVTPTIKITADQTNICIGQKVIFTAVSTGGGSEPMYEWFVNNVSVQNSTSNTYSSADLVDSDNITCTLTSNSACASPNTASSNEIIISVVENVQPTVEIFADQSEICAGQKVMFKASSNGGGSEPKFEWFVNNVSVQNSTSNIFSSSDLVDNDKVSCIMTSNSACASPNTASSNEIIISVVENVRPTVEIFADQSEICAGQKVMFKASATGGGSEPKFEWFVNNVSVQNSTLNTFSSSDLVNNVKVSCIMTSNSACASPNTASSNEIIISVVENVRPTVEIFADQSEICAGQKVLFKAIATAGGSAPIYDWKVNSVIVQSSTDNTYSSSDLVDSDNITCTLTSNSACASPNTASSNEIIISVVESVRPTVEIFADQSEICAGQKVMFKASATGGGSEPKFEWFVNNVSVQNSTLNTFSSSDLVDNEKVSCTLTSNSSCASSSTAISNEIIVKVNLAFIPSIQLIYSDDTVCKDAIVKLELQTQNMGTGTIYKWYKNGQLVGGDNHLNINQLSQDDAIWCSITTQAVNCNIEVSAISDTFNANVYPATIFEVFQRGDSIFATEGYLAYSWYFNEKLIARGPNNFLVPEKPGLYTVNITDPNGCAGVYASIDFVPTSIKNSKNNIFQIYPNPTDGKIYIQFSNLQKGLIRIYQVNGQEIISPTEVKNLNRYSIDISNYPEGMYIITFEDSKNIWSEKIIKMNR